MKTKLNCFILCLEVIAVWSHAIFSITTTYQSKDTMSELNIAGQSDSSMHDNTTGNTAMLVKTTLKFHKHSQGKQINNRLRKPCMCRNGGTCITSSICICPKEFKGRFCQNRVENISCGNLQHGDVYYDTHRNCRVCHCFDGELICDESFTCEDVTNLINLMVSPHHSGGRKVSSTFFSMFFIIWIWHRSLSFWT